MSYYYLSFEIEEISTIRAAIIKKVIHHLRETVEKMYLKLWDSVKNFYKDFVKAIARAENRPHVLVAYLSADLKTLDDLLRYNTNVHISVCLMHNCICVY